MSNQQVSVPLANPPSSAAGSYWLRMEQESQEPDQATREDVAKFADAIFNVDPCIDESAQQGGKSNPPVDIDEMLSLASALLALPDCDSEIIKEAEYTATLLIYRSFVCEDYVLRVTNGRVGGKTRKQYEIDVTLIVDGFSVELDKTVSKPCDENDTYDYVFESDVPIVRSSGAKIFFENYTSVVHLRYTTEHDEVIVTVLGTGGVYAESTAFAVYVGVSSSVELEPPSDEDGDGKPTCLSVGGGGGGIPGEEPSGEDPICFQTTTVTEKCECTGKEHNSYDVINKVVCPSDETEGAHGVGDTLQQTAFVNCGIIDEYGTDAFYQKNCCVEEGSPVVRCKKKYAVWNGGAGDSSELDAYRGQPNTTLIPLVPDDGICGVHIIEQRVVGDCCDDVEELTVESITPPTIEDPGGVEIRLLGGRGPLKWGVNDGFELAEEWTPAGGRNFLFMSEGTQTCDNARIRVEGLCFNLDIPIPNTWEPPELIFPEGITRVSPGSQFSVAVEGGALPLEWSGGGDITLISSSGRGALFEASEDFCGTSFGESNGGVSVSDNCDQTASKDIASTVGRWSYIDTGILCEMPFSGGIKQGAGSGDTSVVIQSAGYKITVSVTYYGSDECAAGVCPPDNYVLSQGSAGLMSNSAFCYDYLGYAHWDKKYTNGCCEQKYEESEWGKIGTVFQQSANYFEWVC